ncbi:hypothetical protein D3C80_2201450 [compost metagenome]
MAIGDNEGAYALVYLNGQYGLGIYLMGFGNLDVEDAIFISPTITKLLIDGTGIDIIMENM